MRAFRGLSAPGRLAFACSIEALTNISDELYNASVEAFAALADPTRRHIMEMLAGGERSAGDFSRRFALTQPAISQHLRALRDAGLVQVRRDAQRRMYSIDGRGLAQIDAWLSRYRSFWATHLDALEHALNDEDSNK
jgi:DNA-binding transcriptional ArsR family regulator